MKCRYIKYLWPVVAFFLPAILSYIILMGYQIVMPAEMQRGYPKEGLEMLADIKIPVLVAWSCLKDMFTKGPTQTHLVYSLTTVASLMFWYLKPGKLSGLLLPLVFLLYPPYGFAVVVPIVFALNR